MKMIFDDATEITVQQVEAHENYLQVLTVGNTPEQLRVLFSDPVRTKKMTVQERGQIIAIYEGYTEFYRTEEYPGKIYGVMVHRVGKTPEEIEREMQIDIASNTRQITDLQMALCEIYEGMGV